MPEQDIPRDVMDERFTDPLEEGTGETEPIEGAEAELRADHPWVEADPTTAPEADPNPYAGQRLPTREDRPAAHADLGGGIDLSADELKAARNRRRADEVKKLREDTTQPRD